MLQNNLGDHRREGGFLRMALLHPTLGLRTRGFQCSPTVERQLQAARSRPRFCRRPTSATIML